MPGINGWETARLLRANFTVHTPILVISADAFEQDYDQGVGIQARDFIVKPVSVPLLLARIRDKLDLVWIARGNSVDLPPVAEQQPGEVVAMPPLPAVHLQELRDLGALGHVRGILDKLDEIDRLDARFSQFTARLRSNIKAFQLSEYMREIEAGVR
jgi:CheY-like chemotaxis protein